MGDKEKFHMVDITQKKTSFRRAEAQGKIYLGSEAFEMIQEGKLPKGDVLALAEIAGTMAAKNTSQFIPLCHPLPIDHVQVRCQCDESDCSVLVRCIVSTTSKTGVEMEALAGVSSALLSVYDLSKGVDPVLKLSDIRLNYKEGGKRGYWTHPEYSPSQSEGLTKTKTQSLAQILCAVITISDRVSSGESEDVSGPLLRNLIETSGGKIQDYSVIADEVSQICEKVLTYASEKEIRLLMTTGGTGLGPRDLTCLALEKIADRVFPGFGELMRREGARFHKNAWLSCSLACQVKNTLVVALPGSPQGVKESFEAVIPLLSHALHISGGGKHGDGSSEKQGEK